ncbi:MAG: hypothetical protein HKN10_19005, partial [Myxococcales bacterium]|nr:hypothetical protein [Myxococcales bacterium]
QFEQAQYCITEFSDAIRSIEGSGAMRLSSVSQAIAVNALITAATGGLANWLRGARLIKNAGTAIAHPVADVAYALKAGKTFGQVKKASIAATANLAAALCSASLQAIVQETLKDEPSGMEDKAWTEGYAYAIALTVASCVLTDALGSGILRADPAKFFLKTPQVFATHAMPALELALASGQDQYGRELAMRDVEFRNLASNAVSQVTKAHGEAYIEWAKREVEELADHAQDQVTVSGVHKENLPFLARHFDFSGYTDELRTQYIGLVKNQVRWEFWNRVIDTLVKMDRGSKLAQEYLTQF